MAGMAKHLSPDDRRRLAEKLGVHEATLYQAVTGKGKGFSPAECVRIERESDNELRRWDLRPADWNLIWPELVGTDGAPDVPVSERQSTAAKAEVELDKAVAAPDRKAKPAAVNRSSKPKATAKPGAHTEHAKA